jgi:hypothetical protein
MVRRRSGDMKLRVLAVAVQATFLFGCGAAPSAPGSIAPPQVAGMRDGQFELQIAASQERYAAGQPVNVSTRLTYVGPMPEIVVFGGSAPVLVALEQPDGPFDPGGGSDLVCVRSVMKAGVPIDAPYQKSGGFGGDDPMADQYRVFFADPLVRLPAGTYRFTARADISEGDCGGVTHNLQAAITITVFP